MTNWPILSLTIILPILGILAAALKPGEDGRNAPRIGLLASGLTFVLALVMTLRFDGSRHDYQFVDQASWLPGLKLSYHVGVDGISIWLVLLTALISMIAIAVARFSIRARIKGIVMAILLLEALVIGAFSALDLVLFYCFFEATLIPSFVLIGVWGGDRRSYAAFKFFLFTLLGSLLFLLAILTILMLKGTADIPTLLAMPNFGPGLQFWLFLGMFASFAVKMPLWPLHTWAPDAYAEAPLAGTIMLSGVLSKLGAYGFMRFAVPLVPDAAHVFTPLIFALSVIGIVYTSLIALSQRDMKRLVAYSSVAHMGFVTIGCFTMSPLGLEGALLQMLSHGLVITALFLGIEVVRARTGSYDLGSFAGAAASMPVQASFFVFFALAAIAVPGSSSFVAELLIVVGVFQVDQLVALVAATSMVLGAAYMLWLCRRVVFGAPVQGIVGHVADLGRSEAAIMAVLAVLVLGLGIYPSVVTGQASASVGAATARANAVSGPAIAMTETKDGGLDSAPAIP